MSKRTTTSGYVVAWIVAAFALVVSLNAGNFITSDATRAAVTSPLGSAAWFVFGIASLVMLVLWLGALAALGRDRAWGWFTAVLVLHLVGLGIAGMLAYAIGGPHGRPVESVRRPSVT